MRLRQVDPRAGRSGGGAEPAPSQGAGPARGRALRRWVSLSAVLWTLALAALLLQLVVYLAHAATILAYPFDIDQGEGYDVNAAWLLRQGRPIYTDNAAFPYYSSNYPPLYALAVAGAMEIWGRSLLAGRAVSLAATLLLALLIFLAARVRSNGAGGVVAAGVFFLSNYVYHVTPLARVNALTALLAFAGVWCLTRPARGRAIAGALLLLAALFTKPTAVDAVAAGLLGVWAARRSLAVLVGGVIAGGVLVIGTALEFSTRGAFSLNVLLGNVNPFLPGQLRDYLANFALLHAVPLLLAGAAVLMAGLRGRLDALHWFLLTGGVAALGVGKWGAGESYFLSAIVASSVLAGNIAGRLVARGGAVSAGVAALLLLQCLISAHGFVSRLVPALPDRGLQAAALAAEPTPADLERGYGIVTLLRSQELPSLVEDPGFVLVAGREVVGNATHLRNLHQAGLWSADPLVADLAARRYHTVVLDAELYPEPVLAAIGRYYFLYERVTVYRATQQIFLRGGT